MAFFRQCIYRCYSSSSRKYYLVGQPDKVSNLVPLRTRPPVNEDEKMLFELQNKVWNFNHNFWRAHNEDFQSKKSQFIAQELEKKGCSVTKLTAEELSHFYKSFLDQEYSKHMRYLRHWTKLNFKLTGLSLLVSLKSLFGLSKKLQ